jgi:hypothetical protein
MFAALCCLVALTGCELVAGPLPDPVRPDSGVAAAGGSAGAGGSAAAAGTDAGSGGATGGQAGQGGSSGCQSQCDCDGDGAKSEACGGADCDDHDPKAKPGQSAYFASASANPAVGFDYNCSGNPDRKPALSKQVSCSGVSLLNCDTSTQGFIDQLPACGQSGGWGTCKKGAVACQPDVLEQRVMLCH